MLKLQVLGPGCVKCKKLAEHAEQAAKALGIEYSLEKITDIQEIINFGVMLTPALLVGGEVKVAGRVPSIEELKRLIGK